MRWTQIQKFPKRLLVCQAIHQFGNTFLRGQWMEKLISRKDWFLFSKDIINSVKLSFGLIWRHVITDKTLFNGWIVKIWSLWRGTKTHRMSGLSEILGSINTRKSLKMEKFCPKIWMALKEFGLTFNVSLINVHKIWCRC